MDADDRRYWMDKGACICYRAIMDAIAAKNLLTVDVYDAIKIGDARTTETIEAMLKAEAAK